MEFTTFSLHFFIRDFGKCLTIYYLIFTAVICFVFKNELLTTRVGKWLLIGMAGFWFVRAMEQFVYWEMGAASTIIMVLFFLSGSGLFLVPAIRKL